MGTPGFFVLPAFLCILLLNNLTVRQKLEITIVINRKILQ